MDSSLSSVPPVWPSARPDIMGTTTPAAAASGATMKLVLSPTPPVECLSTLTPGIAERSTVSPGTQHAFGQAADFPVGHPREEHSHQERRHLVVGNVAIGVAFHQELDLFRSEFFPVALALDQVNCTHYETLSLPSQQAQSKGQVFRKTEAMVRIDSALPVTIVSDDPQSTRPDAQDAHSWREESDRCRFRKGRRRKDHSFGQPGSRPGFARLQSRTDGCRRLRPQRAPDDGGQPHTHGVRRAHPAARTVRRQAHVDGLSQSRRQAAGVARSHAAQRDPAVPARRGLGRTRLPGDRSAARHRRRATLAHSDRAHHGRDRGDHAVRRFAGGCAQGDPHVPPGEGADSGDRGEHELPELPALP